MASKNCAKCEVEINEGASITCNICKLVFHYECAGVREATFKKKSLADRAATKCLNCRSPPVEPSTTLEDVIGAIQKLQESVDGIQSEQQKVSLLIAELREEQKKTSEEIKDLVKSQQFLSDQYDELQEKVEKIQVLESTVSEQRKIIQEMKKSQVQSEQYARRVHLELGNIPVKANENVEEIITNLAAMVGVDIQPKDISAAHRLKSKEGSTPGIIVEFLSRKIRNDFLEKGKILKKDKPLKERRYVNESLCPFYRNLLTKAKESCKFYNYKYCWYQGNKVIVRREEGSPKIIIKELEDLKKLSDRQPNQVEDRQSTQPERQQ